MVTVMRQKTFHKPNGTQESNRKAKGCHCKQLVIMDVKPYRKKGKYKTKSMKEIYAELPKRVPYNKTEYNRKRKLRRKLATIKIPMPVGRSRDENPKKSRAARRPRRVVWLSEQR